MYKSVQFQKHIQKVFVVLILTVNTMFNYKKCYFVSFLLLNSSYYIQPLNFSNCLINKIINFTLTISFFFVSSYKQIPYFLLYVRAQSIWVPATGYNFWSYCGFFICPVLKYKMLYLKNQSKYTKSTGVFSAGFIVN